jgi:hypothetical protein
VHPDPAFTGKVIPEFPFFNGAFIYGFKDALENQGVEGLCAIACQLDTM